MADVRLCLGPLASDVQHIGSTAVRGLDAKPVLDVAVALAPHRWGRAVDALAQFHFEDLGEAGVPGRRYLRRRVPQPAANVHLVEPGGTLWTDGVLLRDHLRTHPEAAARYASAKARAALEHPTLLAYSRAKADLVQQLLDEA